MQPAMQRSPAPTSRSDIRETPDAVVLKLYRLWAGSDYGFSDGAGCDDYYVEPAQENDAGAGGKNV